jgi:CheY-like chemotaxis protein
MGPFVGWKYCIRKILQRVDKRWATSLQSKIEPSFEGIFIMSEINSIEKPPRKTSCRLLVAEDAVCIQRSLRLLLHNTQVEVDMAEDGLTACKMAEASQAEGKSYDLILMDMYMPKLNGWDAVHRLRKGGWLGPIVAVSVAGNERERERGLEAGCDDYITKPVTKSKLQCVLERYLDLEHMAEPWETDSVIAMPYLACESQWSTLSQNLPLPKP